MVVKQVILNKIILDVNVNLNVNFSAYDILSMSTVTWHSYLHVEILNFNN